MQRIKVVVKRPDEPYGHCTNISNSLKNLQNTVGGYIEVVQLTPKIIAICNEDGKNLGLEKNFKIPGDVLVGTVIICGSDGEEFADLPIDFSTWKKMLDTMQGMAF